MQNGRMQKDRWFKEALPVSNSAWKVPLSTNLPLASLCGSSASSANTHPFHATLAGLTGNAYTCGPNHWPILHCGSWSWKPLPQPDIPAPLPPIPASGYRDVVFYPPPDAQLCWVRRFPEDCPAQSATWHADTLEFHVTRLNIVLPGTLPPPETPSRPRRLI